MVEKIDRYQYFEAGENKYVRDLDGEWCKYKEVQVRLSAEEFAQSNLRREILELGNGIGHEELAEFRGTTRLGQRINNWYWGAITVGFFAGIVLGFGWLAGIIFKYAVGG